MYTDIIINRLTPYRRWIFGLGILISLIGTLMAFDFNLSFSNTSDMIQDIVPAVSIIEQPVNSGFIESLSDIDSRFAGPGVEENK